MHLLVSDFHRRKNDGNYRLTRSNIINTLVAEVMVVAKGQNALFCVRRGEGAGMNTEKLLVWFLTQVGLR